jgi:hypothetical protein
MTGRLAVVGVAAIALAVVLTPAFAGPEANVASYTGCLTDTGQIVDVAVGDAPLVACSGTETQLHVSGGDITSVLTPSGSGLAGGTENGDASLSLVDTYKLPQGCASGQVAKYRPITRLVPAAWECGNDNVIDRRGPSQTARTPIDTAANLGSDTSATVGADGFGLISYYDITNGDLKVAHCLNAACSVAVATPIDSTGNVGRSSSIAIGADGFGLISYRDVTNKNLKVAHCQNVACSSATLATIDAGGNVGADTSLTIGSDGRGLISYYGNPTADLKVAHCADIACSSATKTALATNAGAVTSAQSTSVATGADGLGLISFGSYQLQGNTLELRLLHCQNVACTSAALTTLDTGGPGPSNSITIGADGLGLISYYDDSKDDLKVAHCLSVACSTAVKTTLDSAGDVGSQTSITIGVDGLGLVGYYDATNQDLKAVHCQNVACSAGTGTAVDTNGGVGGGVATTIGPDGLPLISYYDATNTNLKAAHCSNVFCVGYLRRR